MLRLNRAAALVAAMALPCAIAMPAGALQAKPAPAKSFERDDPAFADLLALEDAANEVQKQGGDTPESAPATIAAWDAVRKAADARILANGKGHPLGGLARVKIAVTKSSIGQIAEALTMVREGKDMLRPYRAAYPIPFAEATALEGYMLTQQGKAEEAIAALESGLADYNQWYDALPADERFRSTVILKSNLEFSLSQTLSRVGRNQEALTLQESSLATRRSGLGPNDPDTIASIYNLAQLLLKVGRGDDAEREARLAVELAQLHVPQKHPSYARALEMLGIVLSRTGRAIEATDYLVRSVEVKRATFGADNLFFGYALHNLGGILHNRGAFAEAEPLFVEADTLFRKYQGENSPFAAGSVAYAGQISFAEGRFGEAVTRLRQAEIQLGANKRDDQIMLRMLPDLIRALRLTGDAAGASAAASAYRSGLQSADGQAAVPLLLGEILGDAERANAASLARQLVDAVRSELLLSSDGSMAQDRRAALEVAMDVAVARGDAALMLAAMSTASQSKLTQATRLRAARLTAENPELAAAVRAAQDAARDLAARDRDYIRAFAGDAGAVAPLRAARDAAAATLDQRRAAVTAIDPGWSMANTAMPDVAAVRAALGPGELFVALVPAYAHIYALAIDGGDARLVRLERPRAEVLAAATALRAGIEATRLDPASAHALYAELFPGAIGTMLARADHVRVFAGGELAALPLAALVTRPPGGSDSARARWLIEDHALTMVSDLSALVAAAPRATADRPLRDQRLLAIADPSGFAVTATATAPVMRGDTGIARYFGSAGINRDELARLPALPSSRAEATTMAALFGPARSTLLLGDAATEAQLRTAAREDYGVILFATHGLVAGELESLAEPALVLSPTPDAADRSADGLLTLSEIGELKLAADWVILSACNSAAGGGRGLPAYTGLAEAFRYAGADKLLVSHWPVRDDSAAALTTTMLREYQRGKSPPQALRAAMRQMIAAHRKQGRTDPYLWAPFVLLQ